ncbi:MAG: hypothetical protein JO147_00825 [Actinobacteria bacterium]|nr:hypothetical protein [Actinomycetota bacterium]
MRKSLVAAVAVLGIGAAGCSSSTAGSGHGPASESAGSSAPATSAGSTTSATSTASNPHSGTPDKAALSKVVLTVADLPGWTGSPHESDPGDAADQAALVKCAGGKDTAGDQVAEADSPDFDQSDASISSSATSFKSQSDIDADVALLKSPKISSCYEQLAKTQVASALPGGATVDSVSFAVTPGPGTGPSNVAGIGKGTVTVTVSGQQTVVYVDVAFITGRLTEAEIDIENPGQAVPVAFFDDLVHKVADRAANV